VIIGLWTKPVSLVCALDHALASLIVLNFIVLPPNKTQCTQFELSPYINYNTQQGDMQVKNKIVQQIIQWLFARPAIVVDVRPTHRDIYLNSAESIGVWLAMIDQPCVKFRGVPLVYEPTLEVDDPPLLCSLRMVSGTHSDTVVTNTGAGGGRASGKEE